MSGGAPVTTQATTFLTTLFGRELPEKTAIAAWSPKMGSLYLRTPDDVGELTGHRDRNVYVSVCIAPPGLSRSQRPKANEVVGMPGVWADIDVEGGPGQSAGKRAAPDRAAALEVASSILPPTMIVNSGYGLQAWWLFDEIVMFGSEEERKQAERISRGFQALLRREAEARGSGLDSTHDLARLMRLPGTFNTKGTDPVPVELLEHDGPRHSFEAIAEVSLEAMSTSARSANGGLSPRREVAVVVRTDAEAPAKCAALIENDDTFRRTWERRRDFPSQSEYDLSIASLAAAAGWTDQEITDTIVQHRRDGGEELKRRDYYERTIAKARAGSPGSRRLPPEPGSYPVTFTDDKKRKLVLADTPAPDDNAGQAAWLTSVFRLDPRHPVTGAEHQGARGAQGHVVIRRAEAPDLRFEPAKEMTSGRALRAQLPFQLLPTDGETYGFVDEHAVRIAHVTNQLCGASRALSEAQETLGILGTFLSDAELIEGETTHGTSGQRFQALDALRWHNDPRSGLTIGRWHYLIDAETGAYVIRSADLQGAARRHTGASLPRGWLDARMEDLGWERIDVQGFALSGRKGRKGPHLRASLYRGFLPDDEAVNT